MSNKKCEHTTYAGIFGAMDGEGPSKCYQDAVEHNLCADHGGARSIVTVGQIPNTEPYTQEQQRRAYDQADQIGSTHRTTFKLNELFSKEELRHPDKCELELITQLMTENTNGHLATRAMLVVKRRSPTSGDKKGPYR